MAYFDERALEMMDMGGMFTPTANPFMPANRPKAVLFGDSMSEYVGYNPDGSPNTKYGGSVADVISKNLGIPVNNLATGGETSYEALNGGSKFGSFANYIAQNRPEYAIIRYGAADAIKSKDPQQTLASIQQMVDIAKANGVTPVLVGVSELYGQQNSKTGGIAGYIDAGAEQRANVINQGIAQIAAQNGVSFTDVRSMTSAGSGDLLDGVHSNVEFGKQMADAISANIAKTGAIQGIQVPPVPADIGSKSPQEKAAAYNQLRSQGYSEDQIRTAVGATVGLQTNQDWNALTSLAANPPAAAPAPALSASGLAETAQKFYEENAQPWNPEAQFGPVGQFQYEGKTYTVNPDGSFYQLTDLANGTQQYQNFDQSGQVTSSGIDVNPRGPSWQQGVGQALAAAMGSAIGGPLGASIGSGLFQASQGAGLEESLKSAALAGAGAYAGSQVGNLFANAGYDAAFAAADAAQLANQGLDVASIAQNLSTYVDTATANALASAAANQAFALADANQLLKQGLNTDQITQVLQSSGVAPELASSVAQAASEGVNTVSATDLVSDIKYQPQTKGNITASTTAPQVEVTGQSPVTPSNLDAALAAIGAPVYTPSVPPSERVNVQAPTAAPAPSPLDDALAAVGAVTTPVTAPAPTQTVDVQAPTAPAPAPSMSDTVGGLLGGSVTLPTTAPMPSVEVTGSPVSSAPDNVAESTGGMLGSIINQTVPVTSAPAPAPTADTGSDIGSIIDAIINQSVPVTASPSPAPTTDTGSDVGSVVGSIINQTVPVTGSPVSAPSTDTGSDLGSVIDAIINQTVPVTAAPAPAPVSDTGSDVGATVGSIINQTVPVTGSPVPDNTNVGGSTGGLLSGVSTLPGTPTVAPTPAPAPTETVNVTAPSVAPAPAPIAPVIGSVLPVLPPAPLPVAPAPIAAPAPAPSSNSLFTPNDLLKLVSLLGGMAAGGAASGGSSGGFTGDVPTQQPLNYNSDYYNAIQRYYNSYMPQTPRDVAGPLQQWYENKYGA